MTNSSTAEVHDKGPLLLLSQRFAAWLAAADVCLALTTYQAGRLFFIGRKDDGGIRAHERIIEQCQGLWTDGQTLWTSAGGPQSGVVGWLDARKEHWRSAHIAVWR